MYNGNNPTALQSKSWLAEALLNEMKARPYGEITIKNLCSVAGLSRQTFYNLFESKEDILRQYLRDEVNRAKASLMAHSAEGEPLSPRRMADAFAEVLFSNWETLALMMRQGLGGLIAEEIAKAVTLFANSFANSSAAQEDKVRMEMAVAFLSGGLAQIMLCQLCMTQPMSRSELTDLLTAAMHGELYDF